jgi:putative ABC transport system permease protein
VGGAAVNLAWKEVRRAPVRFGLLVGAIGLLVFLILFQQALQDALITSFVGGVRNQSAPVLVYNVDAQRTLQASAIPPPVEEQVRSVDGVESVVRVEQDTFTVRIDGDEPSDAAIVGADDPELVRPDELSGGRRPEAAGEAVGSDVDFEVGDEVEVVPPAGGEPATLTVVGVAPDVQLSVTPTLFTDVDTFATAAQAASPGTTASLPNALALFPADGVTAEEVVAAVDEAAPDAEALTREEAADTSPGVAQVRQSFQVIFLLYGLVVPLVTGLFFLIVTLQKSGSLTLLRAMGAPTSTLTRSLLFQVVLVLGAGLLLGTLMYAPLSGARIGGLALRFDPAVVLTWAVLLVVLGLISAIASLRRVLRIDPVEATVGAGIR